VLFSRLSRPELRRIVGMLLEETRERLLAKGVELIVDDAAADLLAGLGSRPELGRAPAAAHGRQGGGAAAGPDAPRG
jgi:ATP-dependent Clp protease ATP-binding subunit ClpC